MQFKVEQGTVTLGGKKVSAPNTFTVELNNEADAKHLKGLCDSGILSVVDEESEETDTVELRNSVKASATVDTSKYDDMERSDLFALLEARGQTVSPKIGAQNLRRLLAKLDLAESAE
ncbi:MAG: hypothetical protein AB9866_21655 [Syntrophobacteraceae bacterium]